MIKMVDVSQSFRSGKHVVEALREINLNVQQGQFVAVIGRSGCGKSTLLRLIAGLLSPTSGQVLVDGSRVAAPRRDVALSLELQRLHKEFASTTVFVTHSIQEAVLLADRVVVLSPHPGRVRRVIDIEIPQPRSLGPNSHLAEVSTVMAELHELLLTSQSQ
jgi:ABC-type nitrate/sulfonate/bicarbonate transport system ATPase subunit